MASTDYVVAKVAGMATIKRVAALRIFRNEVVLFIGVLLGW